jgi:nucleoid DNA-binding protein
VNKNDLIREVAARTTVSQGTTARVVEEFLGAIRRSLSDGRRVQLRRFGAFDLRRRRSRAIRNPRNGRVYRVPGKLAPVFRWSRSLLESIGKLDRPR